MIKRRHCKVTVSSVFTVYTDYTLNFLAIFVKMFTVFYALESFGSFFFIILLWSSKLKLKFKYNTNRVFEQ